MTLTIITGIAILIVGVVIGKYLTSAAYDSQPWEVMRWNTDVFGYRPVKQGSFLKRGDNIIMALRMNSDEFPEDGLQYVQDD